MLRSFEVKESFFQKTSLFILIASSIEKQYNFSDTLNASWSKSNNNKQKTGNNQDGTTSVSTVQHIHIVKVTEKGTYEEVNSS